MAMMLKTECIAVGRLQAGVKLLCLVTANFPKRNKRYSANKSDNFMLLLLLFWKKVILKKNKINVGPVAL